MSTVRGEGQDQPDRRSCNFRYRRERIVGSSMKPSTWSVQRACPRSLKCPKGISGSNFSVDTSRSRGELGRLGRSKSGVSMSCLNFSRILHAGLKGFPARSWNIPHVNVSLTKVSAGDGAVRNAVSYAWSGAFRSRKCMS